MIQLILLVAALLLGYAAQRLPLSDAALYKLMDLLIMLILLLMGYGFGVHAKDLWLELLQVAKTTTVFVLMLFVFNIGCVAVYFRWKKSSRIVVAAETARPDHLFHYIFSAMKYIVLIVAGMAIGVWLQHPLAGTSQLVAVLLIIILFIVGHQLRSHGLSLRQLLLNKLGVQVALLLMLSSWLAGLLAAKLMGLSLMTGLLYSSGFGWYSLSGILVSHIVSHQAGTIVFFIDVIRELIALFCIPLISAWQAEAMVAYCGATAMDFTLPMLKQHVGRTVVPIAMTSGMLLTLVTPVAITVLAHMIQ